jgi:hypothetical protein
LLFLLSICFVILNFSFQLNWERRGEITGEVRKARKREKRMKELYEIFVHAIPDTAFKDTLIMCYVFSGDC